uniref:Uncharacterized protein n=1 Tax=Rhizophora mucronata TaxID=61149 RepID=A0A2P2NVD2_RHIMU
MYKTIKSYCVRSKTKFQQFPKHRKPRVHPIQTAKTIDQYIHAVQIMCNSHEFKSSRQRYHRAVVFHSNNLVEELSEF